MLKTYRSHCLKVQEAIIHNDTMKTNSTVPGHIVINVFKTNLQINSIKIVFFIQNRCK